MVYMSVVLAKANEVFAPTQDFAPSDLAGLLSDAGNMAQAAELLGLEDIVEAEWQGVMRDFLASVPPAIDAAAMAAIRSALDRGVRVTLTWEPAYAFGLHVWEVSRAEDRGWVGMVNVHITSRDPEWEREPERSRFDLGRARLQREG